MSHNSYKIVPHQIPAIRLSNKQNENFNNNKHKIVNRGRSIDTECLACEYISDGSTVIKLSELVRKLKEKKEINLVPLSLSFNENTTEFVVPNKNEAFCNVTVHVNVESQPNIMIPYQIICFTEYSKFTFNINSKEEFDNDKVYEQYSLIQLYPKGEDKNVIEIKLNIESIDDLEEGSWFCLIPKKIFGITKRILINGLFNEKKYTMYDLESYSLQQNQKITVLNYL